MAAARKRGPDENSNYQSALHETSLNTQTSNLALFEIKKLYYDFFSPPLEAIPVATSTDPYSALKKVSIFITEIIIGALGGFIGLHSIIARLFLGGAGGYILSAIFCIADASINYALMFPAYKAAAGLKLDGKKFDETKETMEQLNNLNKILDFLLKNKAVEVTEEDYLSLKAIYSQLNEKIKHEKGYSPKKMFFLAGSIALFLVLFSSVVIMRIGGGDLFFDALSQNFLGKDHFSLQWDAPSIVAGCSMGLYILSAILTRKDAILDWIYPLRPGKFEKTKKKLNQLRDKGGFFDSSTSTDSQENNDRLNSLILSDKVQKLCQNYSIKQANAVSKKNGMECFALGVIIFSEIIFGILLNDFVGMCSALSFWHSLYAYVMAGLVSLIDTGVQFTLMFPVLKATVCQNLGTEAQYEQKMRDEELIYLSQIISEVLKQENAANGQTLAFDKWDQLIHTCNDFKQKNQDFYAIQVSYCKKFIEYFFLFIFVALRAANSYFLLSHFLLGIGVTVTGAWWLIPGLFMALYTYNGYVTRKSSISSLFQPAEAQEFNKLTENLEKMAMMKKFKDELKARQTSIAEINGNLKNVEEAFFQIYQKEKKEDKNLAFQIGSELIFSATRRNNCLDTILFFKRRQQWKESIGNVRQRVFNELKDQKAGFTNATSENMFTQHRDWWAFLKLRETATVSKIKQEIISFNKQGASVFV